MYKKVDTLFGIESQIVRDDWAIPPMALTAANIQQMAKAAAAAKHEASVGMGFSKQMADDLSKKLTRT